MAKAKSHRETVAGSAAGAAGLSPLPFDSVPLSRRQHAALLVVFVAALVIRGLYLWGQAHHNPVFAYPQMDGLVHHKWARQIAAGEGMEPRPYFRAPLYYYLLAAIYKVAGPNVIVAYVFGAVLGAVNCYMIARLGRTLGGFRAGLLAGVLAAVYWPFIYFDAALLSTGLEVFLDVGLLLAFLAAGRRGNAAAFLGAGIVWGLAALARANVLAIMPAVWVWAWRSAGANGPRRWQGPIAATAGLLVAVLPVTLRNYFVGGEAVLVASSGGVNFYIGNNPQATGYLVNLPGARKTWDEWLVDVRAMPERELGRPLTDGEVSDYWYERAWRWIRANPAASAALMVHKLRLFWSPVELPNNQPIGFLARRSGGAVLLWIGFPIIATLALPGLLAIRGAGARRWFLPLAFVLIYMLTVVAFFCPARFRVPVVPVLIVLAARGLCDFAVWARGRRFRVMGGYAAALALAAAFVATNPPDRAAFRQMDLAEGHFLMGRYLATPWPDGPGDLPGAAAEYRRAVAVDPAGYRRLALARVLAEIDDAAGASEQYRLAVEENPEVLEPRLERGQFLVERNDLAGALREYREASKLAPQRADVARRLNDVQFNLGTKLLGAGQVAAAAAQLEEVLARDRSHVQAWQNLGVAHARLGRFDEAITAFREALTLDAGLAEASVNLARALTGKGAFAEAADVLQRGLAATPDDVNLLVALARLLATAPDPAHRDGRRALQLAQHAADLTPTPSLPLLEAWAAANAEVGRYNEAVRLARQGLQASDAARSSHWAARFERALALYLRREPLHEAKPGP